jgi:hypothetical protein
MIMTRSCVRLEAEIGATRLAEIEDRSKPSLKSD